MSFHSKEKIIVTSEQPEGLNLEPHPLVRQLHSDPDDAQDLISLVGYLGPSKQPDQIRLYSDLSFRHYYEIPSDGIVATTPTNADDPNSPTIVHVKASTRIDVVSVASQNVEAGFLRGAITSGYLGSAAGSAGQGGVIQPTPTASVMTQCGACPTRNPQHCPSFTICTVCTQFPPCPGGQAVGGEQVAGSPTPATVCTQMQGCLWPTTLCIHTVNACPQAGVGGAAQVGTIGPTGVFHCTTATVATVCTQGHGCVGPTTFCQAGGRAGGPQEALIGTGPYVCWTTGCQAGGVGQAQAAAVFPTTHCTHLLSICNCAAQEQAAGVLPPSIGCTALGCTWACTQGCTFTPVCHHGGAGQGQAAQVGAAHPTGMPGCTWVCTQGCTFTPVCPQGGAGQAQTIGPTGIYHCTFTPHCPPRAAGQAQVAGGLLPSLECTWNLPHCPPGGGVPHSHLLGCTWVCTQGCTFTPVCPTIQCP